jgi:hypothetical protein
MSFISYKLDISEYVPEALVQVQASYNDIKKSQIRRHIGGRKKKFWKSCYDRQLWKNTSQEDTANFKSLIKQKLSGNQQKPSLTKSHKVCGSYVSMDSQAIVLNEVNNIPRLRFEML